MKMGNVLPRGFSVTMQNGSVQFMRPEIVQPETKIDSSRLEFFWPSAFSEYKLGPKVVPFWKLLFLKMCALLHFLSFACSLKFSIWY